MWWLESNMVGSGGANQSLCQTKLQLKLGISRVMVILGLDQSEVALLLGREEQIYF